MTMTIDQLPSPSHLYPTDDDDDDDNNDDNDDIYLNEEGIDPTKTVSAPFLILE